MRNVSFHLAAASLALAAFAAPAHATDTVSFPWWANGAEGVSINLNYGSGSPLNVSESVSAGGFLTSWNLGPTFESYCVDVYQWISFGDSYNDYTAPGTTHVFHNANAYNDLGKLYAAAGLVNTPTLEAAFQMAVWEIVYENTGTAYSLTGGAATFAGSEEATKRATTWLNSLDSLKQANYPGIQVMESSGHQDVIVMVPVPEPETYALFLAGLAAIGFVVRRRKA